MYKFHHASHSITSAVTVLPPRSWDRSQECSDGFPTADPTLRAQILRIQEYIFPNIWFYLPHTGVTFVETVTSLTRRNYVLDCCSSCCGSLSVHIFSPFYTRDAEPWATRGPRAIRGPPVALLRPTVSYMWKTLIFSYRKIVSVVWWILMIRSKS